PRQPRGRGRNNGRYTFTQRLDRLADLRHRFAAERFATAAIHGNPAPALAGTAAGVLVAEPAAQSGHGHGHVPGLGGRCAVWHLAGPERVDPDLDHLPGVVVAAAVAHVSDVAAVPGDSGD